MMAAAKKLRTQIGIVGAGPAGLLLSHLLHLEGIDSIVVETQTRKRAEERIRAGVLEQATTDLLNETGLGERMRREGLVHHGIELRFKGKGHRIDMHELTGGRAITVYGQHEVVRDLIQARVDAGGQILFECSGTAVHDLESDAPRISFQHAGEEREIVCDYIAGCDGFHGICRPAIPSGILKFYEKVYPFGWLGILAEVAPAAHELIYANHERGFALLSMRSPTVSRLYLQCRPDEDVAEWGNARLWDELRRRLQTEDGFALEEGPIIQKSVTAMRSFVTEPMQYGRLFLAGDAAHIVPPTGAKGLNLAVADIWVLGRALSCFYRKGNKNLLQSYSDICLQRVWRVQHFSWWMTSMLHNVPDADAFDQRRHLAELEQVVSSRAAAMSLAENYTGLPFSFRGETL